MLLSLATLSRRDVLGRDLVWTTSRKLLVASAIACAGLLMFAAAVSMSDDVAPSFVPKDGGLVAIFSKKTGKYLEVSPHDGRLRATAATAKNNDKALFRVMVLTKPMVDMLIDSMHTANNAEWSKRRHWTGRPPAHGSTAVTNETGCPCSGYSNDHGFGAYCYGWEYESQVPWCYVHDECTSQPTRGSFGRKYADCLPIDDFGRADGASDGFDASRRPDWLDDTTDDAADGFPDYAAAAAAGQGSADEGFPDYMRSPWDASVGGGGGGGGNWSDFAASQWDETANFTGMDEYRACAASTRGGGAVVDGVRRRRGRRGRGLVGLRGGNYGV